MRMVILPTTNFACFHITPFDWLVSFLLSFVPLQYSASHYIEAYLLLLSSAVVSNSLHGICHGYLNNAYI